MTVSELRKILKGLPSSMEVCVVDNDNVYAACNGTTGITVLNIDGKDQHSLLITPCKCHEETDYSLN